MKKMLSDDVSVLKGDGKKVKETLAKLHIYTIKDLLEYFPFRYDIAEMKHISEFIHDDIVTVTGKVVYPPTIQYYGRKRSRLRFTIEVDGVALQAVLFNRAFAKKQFTQGKTVTLTGKWDARRLQITVHRYKMGSISADAVIEPGYSVTEGISNFQLRKFIYAALDQFKNEVAEILPPSYLTAYKIPSRRDALEAVHRPKSKEQLKHARRRFTYEEFLLFQLKIQLLKKRQQLRDEQFRQQIDHEKIHSFISSLPFTLTNAQHRALREILRDMEAPIQMNRLLQGDVGSGKTAVAIVCLLATVTASYQGALMVPTEILAEQHYDSICNLLGNRTHIALLTSSVTGKERKAILQGVADGTIDTIIGTHSLIQEDVQFHRLGLIIIDEQHRFGVEQRKQLREKGLHPDVLFMTATPIPRTLAITAFGDMDVSTIDEMPKGRKKVQTFWVKEEMLQRVLTFIEKRIDENEQVYVVSPLIEESDAFDYENALELYNKLSTYFGERIHIGLLHGRLRNDEKEAVMKQFMNNDIQLLVATTVIEVGVNVPNATVMVIFDAERFGFAQLHQLRGRIGRGDKQGYCILIADPKGDTGKERMHIMTKTTDGFHLAEEDLKLRGPGDLFGKKQSGLPNFKVADMVHDYRALETARRDAERIVKNNLLETDEMYVQLRKYMGEEAENVHLD